MVKTWPLPKNKYFSGETESATQMSELRSRTNARSRTPGVAGRCGEEYPDKIKRRDVPPTKWAKAKEFQAVIGWEQTLGNSVQQKWHDKKKF